jgi:hypothetical protein
MYFSNVVNFPILHSTHTVVRVSLLLSEHSRKVRRTVGERIQKYALAYILKFDIQFCITRNLYSVQPLQDSRTLGFENITG